MRSTGKTPARAGLALTGMSVVTLVALGVLSACSPGGSSGGSASDSRSAQAGRATSSPLPPGKYRTLPQPCTAVDADTLKSLVPDAKDYAGHEALTYDTDRRVGCAWQGRTPHGVASSLVIDMERVVSYDPDISDEAQAEADFDQRATAASISLVPPSSTTPATPTTGSTGSGSGTGSGPGSAAGTSSGTSSGTRSGSGSGTSTGAGGRKGADSGGHAGTSAGTGTSAGANTDPAYQPRLLTGLGDTAFINDVLKTASSGPRRNVTVVFRTANVVVSVTYSVAEPAGSEPAKSADLQKYAQQVASQLEHKVEK